MQVGTLILNSLVVALCVAFFVLPWAVVIMSSEARQEARLRRHGDATCRTEHVAGKEYFVYTRPFPVVREKRTGRVGIAQQRGFANDPLSNNRGFAVAPEWIRIQFFRKTDGQPGRAEWRRFDKFEIVGKADVDFLSHRVSLFRTDRLVRYHVNLAELGGSNRRAHPPSR